MIMVGPLGPSARACVPWSFVVPRACAVAAFVRPLLGPRRSSETLQLSTAAPKPGQYPANGNCGSWRRLAIRVASDSCARYDRQVVLAMAPPIMSEGAVDANENTTPDPHG